MNIFPCNLERDAGIDNCVQGRIVRAVAAVHQVEVVSGTPVTTAVPSKKGKAEQEA